MSETQGKSLEKVVELLRTLASRGFFGELTVTMQNGVVHTVRESKVHKIV